MRRRRISRHNSFPGILVSASQLHFPCRRLRLVPEMLCKISASLLKSHYHFTTLAFPPPPPLSAKPSFLRIRFALRSSLAAASYSPSISASIPYGPSIHKGAATPNTPEGEGGGQSNGTVALDEERFARVFELTALRVPSSECFSLESRLRGHLLNWPRIPNIARVAGDEVDEDTSRLLGGGAARLGDAEGSDGGVDLDVLERRVFGRAQSDGEVASGGVLCRDKLANTFNSQGYVRFRNLAKISKPKRRKKKEGENMREFVVKRGNRKSNFAVVDVLQEEEETAGGMERLLGVGYKRQWRGSTRLLLLDERCVGKPFEELPEAIKAVFIEGEMKGDRSKFELVPCRLTLFYDYWSVNEVLEFLLPAGTIIPSSFETIGHIAHLNLKEEHLPFKNLIAKVVLDKNKPKIQTVVNKTDVIDNDYRTMQLEVLAGNHSLVATVIENGLKFQVDLSTVYWNSRLSTERLRLISGFTHDDVICDVFAGVGPIAISAARIVKRVYANDLNPSALDCMERNILLNKLERKIKVFNMDGRRFVRSIFSSDKAMSITHVVMNLPNSAVEFLDAFKGIYQDKPKAMVQTLPVIHVYGFSKAEDPDFDFHERIRIALNEVSVQVDMRRVRLVAPGKWMLCAKFILPQSVVFARTIQYQQ
ncbi:hypothetical protein MLD38_012688 [Melastoma candidum]|uniref:Uncharacterized protein n=1 Tax=Melastoma candidum TaxID=119954 RepID=A0ACB9R8Y6_9MYRT|nr:hypothetical protein MLD38_012688 [Melastoma candidum]